MRFRFFEDVETAKVSGRKQFNAMVAWLKQNKNCKILLVEKTDRAYRNFRDAVTLEDLDVEIHLVKEAQIISKDAKSQAKLIHGINLVLARNYSENLREEVKKGMKEKALQGIYPGHAPFGYRNNKAERTIEVDPTDSLAVIRIMQAYASGSETLSTVCKILRSEFGKSISKGGVHLILKNRFYIGEFQWGGETYHGTHPLFISPKTFAKVQDVLAGHNRPKYSKREIAFRGLMSCSNDGCMLTGDVQKEKYVYYRCTGSRGKCNLPRFKEEVLAERLGQPLKNLQVPQQIVDQIVEALHADQANAVMKHDQEKVRLEARLKSIQRRMDAAYLDKLDGKISEEFWARKAGEWRTEELEIQRAIQNLQDTNIDDRAIDAQRVFELANKAYFLYESQDSMEKAKLLKMLCSNFSVDSVSATPAYRYPFNLIADRAISGKWSGRLDSN